MKSGTPDEAHTRGFMQFFSKNEAINFLKDFKATYTYDNVITKTFKVNLEDALRRSAVSAGYFTSLLGENQDTFLFITDYGVWPSLENSYLFECLRAKSGESRSLGEVSGHKFNQSEKEALISYIQILVISGWGGIFLGVENGNKITFSHDSWSTVELKSGFGNAMAMFRKFNFPVRMLEENPKCPSGIIVWPDRAFAP